MSTPDITIYWTQASNPCRPIKLLVDHHGAADKVKFQNVNLAADEQFEPWFLELNPFHTIPVLRDKTNNVTVTESSAIIEYLAKIFNWTGEWGVGDFNVVNALHKYHTSMAKSCLAILDHLYGTAFAGAPFDLEAFKASLAGEKAGYFVTFNSILEKNNGFITGKPSAADVLYWVNLYHFSLSKHPKGSNNVLRIYDFQDFPAIRKWLTVMEEKWFSEEEWADLRKFVASASPRAPGINLLDQE